MELGCVVGRRRQGHDGASRELVREQSRDRCLWEPSCFLDSPLSCATETFHHSDHTCNNLSKRLPPSLN